MKESENKKKQKNKDIILQKNSLRIGFNYNELILENHTDIYIDDKNLEFKPSCTNAKKN